PRFTPVEVFPMDQPESLSRCAVKSLSDTLRGEPIRSRTLCSFRHRDFSPSRWGQRLRPFTSLLPSGGPSVRTSTASFGLRCCPFQHFRPDGSGLRHVEQIPQSHLCHSLPERG